MAVRTYTCVKTGKTKFEAYVHMRSRNDCSIRVQKAKRCSTEREAIKEERRLIRVVSELIAKEEARGNCWAKVISQWEYEAYKYMRNPKSGRSITQKTIRDSVNMLCHWTENWLPIPAKELNAGHGKSVLQHAEDAELSKSSVQKLKHTINTVYDFGIQKKIILGVSNSPVYGIPITIKDDDKLPEILTVDEVQRLLMEAKARNHAWYPIWAIALMTGMRSSELFALRKESVLLHEGLIRINESWDWMTNSAKATKANYWRNAPIAEPLRPVLKELFVANNDSEFLLPRFPEWIHGDQAGVLRAFCKRIGITSVRFHTLRACFATHLLASGVDEAVVMRIGGWRAFKTFQIYVRLAGIKEKGATDNLGNIFLPKENVLKIFPQIA